VRMVRKVRPMRHSLSGEAPSGTGKGGEGSSTQPGQAPTAVCLVGAARDFEATGPSLLTRLVAAYRPCAVFLHSPLEHNSAKLSLLAAARSVAAVRIFASADLDEGALPAHLLRGWGSPNSLQVSPCICFRDLASEKPRNCTVCLC